MGLESRARCAGFSVTEIGNRKECLRVREAGASAAGRGQRPYASFPDRQPNVTPVTPSQARSAQRSKNQGAKRPLIPLPLLQTHPCFFRTPFSPSQNRLNPPSPPPKSDTHPFLLTRAILRNFLYIKKSGSKPALFLQNPLVCSFLMLRAPRRSPSSSLRVRLRFPCAAFQNPTARSSASASL